MSSANGLRQVGYFDCPGGGQIVVAGTTAFIGHMRAPAGTSIVDIADPAHPRLLARLEMPPGTHSHKVRVHNGLMLINRERNGADKNAAPENFRGGLGIYDVTKPASPREIGRWETDGMGVHRFDFDGRHAYISPTVEGFRGNIAMILDLGDPAQPREVGRWWMPGQWTAGGEEPTWQGTAHRCHHPLRQGDRLYVSYWHGGFVILDIADKTHPKLVAHRSWQSQDVGFAHTVLPIPSRGLAIQTEEAVETNCKDWPKRDWVWDISDEKAPVALSVMPPPADFAALCKQGGRFGAHNIAQNRPDPTARNLRQSVVGSFFNGGVRAYSIADPHDPKEIGFLVEAPPKGNASHSIQINDVYVDENGLIYANDRFSGGLDIIRYTGPVPLE
jgi:hypothetical protein